MKKAKLNSLSQKKLLSFISNSLSGCIILNNLGKVVYANRAMENLLEIAPDKLYGNFFFEFIDDLSKDEFNRFFRNGTKTLHSSITSIILKSKNNKLTIALLEGRLMDEDDFFIWITNISTNTGVIEKLIAKQFKYDSILENLNDGFAILDTNNHFLFSNKTCETIFDVQHEGLTGHTIFEFIDDDIFAFTGLWNSFKISKNTIDIEIKTPKRTNKTICVSGTPLYNTLGESTGILVVFSEVTIQRMQEKETERRLELEKILSKISNDFVHIKAESINRVIDNALMSIGKFADVDRSYLFLFKNDMLFCDNTNEWCNEGIEPQIDNLKDIPVELIPWWMVQLKAFETIHIPFVAELPTEAESEKEILEAQDIKSVLVIPLLSGKDLIGFLGFDSVKTFKNWDNNDIAILKTIGEIMGNGFSRMKFEDELKQINRNLEQKVIERTTELENIHALNRLIIEKINLIVITTDSAGFIMSFNPYAEEILGFNVSESADQIHFFDLLHPNKEIDEKTGNKPAQYEKSLFTDYAENEIKKQTFNVNKEFVLISSNGTETDVLLSLSKIETLNGLSGFVFVAVNITERKLAERMLEQRDAENRAIVGAVPDMMFKLDSNGNFLDFINNSFISPFQSPQYFIGKNISEILPTEIANQSLAALNSALNSGTISQFEYMLKIDGEIKYFENRINAISQNEAFSFVREITHRKNAENILRNTTQNLTHLIQSLNAGTLFENSERKVTLANQRFCDLFELPVSPEALIGYDCVEAAKASLFLMKYPESFLERINEILLNQAPVFNDELYLKNGKVYERDYIPITYNQNLIGHLWQYRDITERKSNEQNAIIQRDLGFKIAGISDLNEVMELVTESLVSLDDIHAAGIYLINNKTRELELKVHHGLSEDFVRTVKLYHPNEYQYKMVIQGNPVYGFYDELMEVKSTFNTENLEQIGIIPVKHEDTIIGSINIASRSKEKLRYSTKLSLEIISTLLGSSIERIRIENNLSVAQKNFNLMFDTIDDFMFILDNKGNIIRTNPIVEKRLGFTQQELVNMSVLELHPPDRREEAAFIVNEMLDGRLDVCPVPLHTKNGSQIPVETKVVIGKWDGNDALYGISRDITERVKSEEKLRKSEIRWQFALESSGDGAWDWNLLTNEVFYSLQWKNMLGYADHEIENRIEEWETRVHPDDLAKCHEDLNDHIAGKTEFYRNEHRMRCKDGNFRWILDRAKIIEWTEEGKPIRIIGTHSDITQRKLFEEQLKKSVDRERELNDLKSRFVSTATHEFRTPLATILMLSEILIHYQNKMKPEDISEKVNNIREHVLHLSGIVNDVLQLSKINEGKIIFNPDENNIIELTETVISRFRTTLKSNDIIQFKSDFTSLICMTDKQLLSQAMNNLISNALKYSPVYPKVTVEIKQSENEILFIVKDNGIGIPEQDRKHMFTPFFRASNTKTIQGNGLGLSILKEAVQMHKGYVTYQSSADKGTVFTIHLPAEIIIKYT